MTTKKQPEKVAAIDNNDKTDINQTPPTKQKKKKAPPVKTAPDNIKSPRSTLAVIALLAAISAGAGSFYVWNNTQQSNETLLEKIAASAHSVKTLSSTLTEQKSNSNETLLNIEGKTTTLTKQQSQLEATQQQLATEQQQLGDVVKTLHQKVTKNDDKDWSLAEIEYLIKIANHKLLLSQDIATAIAAMEAADQQLRRAGDPGLFDVRKLVLDSISALRATELPDISGMSLTLTSLSDQVTQLPLKGENGLTAIAPEPGARPTLDTSSWEKAGESLLNALKGLVSIKKVDHADTALMPPKQRSTLYQNLQLKLEAARLALLQGDSALFRANITIIQQWINTYFEKSAISTTSLLSTLSQFQSVELSPTLPNLSKPLKAIQAKITDERTAP